MVMCGFRIVNLVNTDTSEMEPTNFIDKWLWIIYSNHLTFGNYCSEKIYSNPFHAVDFLLYTLKTSENLW